MASDGNAQDSCGTVRRRFDWSSVRPSMGVVKTVADAKGQDTTAIAPLYDAVDPDALDTLLGHRPDGSVPAGAHVSFRLDGVEVFVSGKGVVTAELLE